MFRFPLPPSCPSSINFGSGLAAVRYEVRATVGVLHKGENKLVFDKKNVDVVEAFEPDFSRADPEAVVVGENGKILLQARLLGGIVVAGQPACVELTVKNHSLKKVNMFLCGYSYIWVDNCSRTLASTFHCHGTSIFQISLRHRGHHFRYRTPLSPSHSRVPTTSSILAPKVWQTSFSTHPRILGALRAVRGPEMKMPRSN
jgi:hypothetical protein